MKRLYAVDSLLMIIMNQQHAKYLGLNVVGTLAVLMKAKSLGYVEELKPLLNKLVDNHIYISRALIGQCLKAVGEIDG